MALRSIELCAGYGGFTLGLRNYGISTVAYVERDSYAAATLVARMAEERLDQAPIWDDLCTFDGAAWRGRVDLITAGFPCQPFSTAGNQRGVDDERWIWPNIAGIIADVRPRYVFLENVTGLIRAGLAHVLADLAALGFDAEWGVLSAAAVGAPHRRQRVWILADAGRNIRAEAVNDRPRETSERLRPSVGRCGVDVADADGPRRERSRPSRLDQQHGAATNGRDNVADTSGINEREPDDETCTEPRSHPRPDVSGRSGDVSDTHRADGATRADRFPPGPDDRAGWEAWTASGGPQPAICRGPNGRPEGLADALHLGGNGLVPQVAAEAFRQLSNRHDARPHFNQISPQTAA